jgi:gas vesicle protein
MKNPFEKEDHTSLIMGLAMGVTAGIGLGYLFLTKKGASYRKQIGEKFKEKVSDKAAAVISNKTALSKKVAKLATDIVVK